MKTLLTFIAYLFSIIAIHAQSGVLDPAFGTTGIVLGPFTTSHNTGNGIAQQPDGKILVAGITDDQVNSDIFIVRYNTDGTFDTTFGSNGAVTDTVGSGSEFCRTMRLRSDGKIFIAGDFGNLTSWDVFVKSYDSTGTLDASFGFNGAAIADISGGVTDQLGAMAIQSDGKIVVGGWLNQLANFDIFLLRFNSDGTVDTSFGSNGRLVYDLGGFTESVTAIEIQTDGKILAAGTFLDIGTNANEPYIMRLLPDGTADTSFAQSGVFIPFFNQADDDLHSLAIQPDRKILIGGSTQLFGSAFDVYIARVDSNGTRDTTFNSSGIIVTDVNNQSNDNIQSIMLQSNGRIVAVGQTTSSTYDILLIRYLSTGAIDTSFGINGFATSAVGTEADFPLAALLQTDNKIVVTGYYDDNGLQNIFTARFLNDSIGSTGIHKNIFSNKIVVYPQPANESLRILNGEKFISGQLLSVDGKIAFNIKNPQQRIDVSFLPAGFYILQCIDRSGTVEYSKILKN
jgi:uncharacterized delta-60 repeat protein